MSAATYVTDTLSSADDAVTIDVSEMGAVGVQLTGTWTGTVSFEATIDGRTWVALNLLPSNSATAASSATANGVWTGAVASLYRVRARFSTATSGSVAATVRAASEGGRA